MISSGVPMAEYLAIKAFSGGMANTILDRSPLHAWIDSPWNPNRKQDDSGVADIGTYAHACLLEGGTNALLICPFDDWRKKEAREMRDAARAEGKLPILEAKVAAVNAMVEAAATFLARCECDLSLDGDGTEITIQFERDGVPCKIRPDWLSPGRTICMSYKTTAGSAQPDAWIRTQLPSYDAGMILYERGIEQVCKVEGVQVIHLVQEQNPPYSCSLIGLDPAWHELAERKLNQALHIWRDCLKANRFPGYPFQIHYATPNSWQIAKVEEMEAAA